MTAVALRRWTVWHGIDLRTCLSLESKLTRKPFPCKIFLWIRSLSCHIFPTYYSLLTGVLDLDEQGLLLTGTLTVNDPSAPNDHSFIRTTMSSTPDPHTCYNPNTGPVPIRPDFFPPLVALFFPFFLVCF